MSGPVVRVVKVGGSLLTFRDLPAALSRWLDEQTPAVNVLVVGGGPWVDALRRAADELQLDEELAHWLSVRAMGITARLLVALQPQFSLVTDVDRLRVTICRASSRAAVVLDCESFLRQFEPTCPGARLPHSWDVTSDSIAARLCPVLGAQELVLLKSSLPEPLGGELDELVRHGYVDRYFPQAARAVPAVRFVNLRGDTASEVRLRWSSASGSRMQNTE